MASNRREIPFRFLGINYSITSDDGVFSKNALDTGTETLLKVATSMELSGSVCDMGCGIGVIGVVLSQHFDVHVTGVDVNPRAVELANLNYAKYAVDGINLVQDGLRDDQHFDVVISNPPIRIGKEKMYRLFDQIYSALPDGGQFLFVIRKSHGAKSAQAKCLTIFESCELLKKDKGFYVYLAVK